MLLMTFRFLHKQAASVIEQPEDEMALIIVLTPLGDFCQQLFVSDFMLLSLPLRRRRDLCAD
jgi:hypothetical protein